MPRTSKAALACALAYPDDVAGLLTLAAAPYGGQVAFHNLLLTIPPLGPLLAHTVYLPSGRTRFEAGLRAAFAPEASPPRDYEDVCAAHELRPGQLLAHAHDQVRGLSAVHLGFLRHFPGLMGKLLGKMTGRVRASGEV
jgi:hypothetical protein